MKTLKKRVSCLLLIAMMIFTSCIKRDGSFIPRASNSPNHTIPTIDTLAGKEIRFDSLIWNYDDNTGNVYLFINSRPDLFTHPRNFEVSLRPEASSEWVQVTRRTANPPSGRFVYSVGMGSLYIFPYPADFSLDSTSASVKVRF